MRVVRFYVSCPASASSPPSARPQLQALDRSVPCRTEQKPPEQSVPCRTSTASARSQCSPPDPNSKLRIVFPAGPPPRAPDQSVPRRTSTAKNFQRYTRENARKNVRRYARYKCQKECHKIWHISGCFLVKIEWQTECHNTCQIECQNECQRKCENRCQKGCKIARQNRCQIECKNILSEQNVR